MLLCTFLMNNLSRHSIIENWQKVQERTKIKRHSKGHLEMWQCAKHYGDTLLEKVGPNGDLHQMHASK